MSFIKSDSLLSNIKNVSIRIDMRPNDGSNIFKSIFSNVQQKQKSIKFQSLFDLDSNLHPLQQPQSLIDKLSNNNKQPHTKQSQLTHHYNWIVCKNAGMSQQEDNNSQNQQKTKKQKQLSLHSYRQRQSIQPSFKQRQSISHLIDLSSLHSFNLTPQNNQKKVKNQTKNIPKNYGKAIICYIQKYRHVVQEITAHFNIDYFALLDDLKKKKKSINTIADLRNLWSKYKYAKCMRVITSVFLRKHALSYIFDSRICTYSSHIKYRQRLCEAVQSPQEFKHIKDY